MTQLYRNKWWRLQNLYYIKSKSQGIVKLKFNNVQKKIIDTIEGQLESKQPIRSFTLKARQQGISTFWLLYWLDDTLFKKGVNTGILAHKRESLGYLMEIVRLAIDKMPSALQPKLGDFNKSSVSFPVVNSKMFCSLSIRSTGLHNLHISEWAFIKDYEIQSTLGATNPLTTNISGETTGNGIGNDAYEIYQEIKRNESNYKGGFYPWFFQEEYGLPLNGLQIEKTSDEKKLINYAKSVYNQDISDEQILWRRNTKKALRDLFPQEYPETDTDAFLMSGTKYFDVEKIYKLYEEARAYLKQHPPYEQNENEIFYEKPSSLCHYAMGVDTSEGAGDFSVIKVINITKRIEAYRFSARVGLDYLYRKCDEIGRRFNHAYMGVERNNHGHAVILGLEQDTHYPNLYKEDKNTRILANGQNRLQRKTGWATTSQSKPIMIDQLKMGLEGDSMEGVNEFMPEITWLDTELFNELLTFKEENGKLEAIAGKHDDNVIATAIAYQMYLRQRSTEGRNIGKTQPQIIIGSQRESRV